MSIKWSDFETMIIEGSSFGNTFLEETDEYQPTASVYSLYETHEPNQSRESISYQIVILKFRIL